MITFCSFPFIGRALRRLPVFTCLAFAVATLSSPAAVTWQDIQFGGFASQGFMINTGHNDYLGETSEGTFDFREYAVNGSWAKGKFRIGAQAFGQKLGVYGEDKIKLDWATVDYQAAQWFGVRVGRVKMPRGLYNEALDLDMIRTQVLMPQSVYDARLRDFNASFDGGMIYGNVTLQKAGSLDYKLFYGDVPMSDDSGASDFFNNNGTGTPSTSVGIGMDSVLGGSLFWNTPVSGLRMGYSYSAFENFFNGRSLFVPQLGGQLTALKMADSYQRHLVSAEYTTGDWVFAAEIGRETGDYIITFSPIPLPASGLNFSTTYGYVSATRRLTPKIAAGAYYSHSIETNEYVGYSADSGTTVFPELRQDDLALSLSFDPTDHLVLKIEGHYMDGAGKIFETPARPQPFANRDESWFLFAAKATIYF